jgi:hypothetical protein
MCTSVVSSQTFPLRLWSYSSSEEMHFYHLHSSFCSYVNVQYTRTWIHTKLQVYGNRIAVRLAVQIPLSICNLWFQTITEIYLLFTLTSWKPWGSCKFLREPRDLVKYSFGIIDTHNSLQYYTRIPVQLIGIFINRSLSNYNIPLDVHIYILLHI